ncbi:MAG: DUF4350 domain-containing protein [Puniceicoccaceae bacterium]
MKKSLQLMMFIGGLLFFALSVYVLLPQSARNQDAFPGYSSLLPNPKGMKVLHNSIERIPGFEIYRNYRPYSELEGRPDTLLVMGGLPSWRTTLPKRIIDGEYDQGLSNFVKSGGTLLIAYTPWMPALEMEETDSSDSAEEEAAEEESDEDKSEDEEKVENRSILKAVAKSGVTSGEFEPFEWRSRYALSLPDEGWQVHQSIGEHPAIASASLGEGSLIVCADAYFLSNEAMLEPPVDFIQWITEGKRIIIFDEWSKGVRDNRSILYLLRKHKLLAFLLSLVATAVLLFWHNSSNVLKKAEANHESASGRQETSATATLLRKDVPVNRLLQTCRELLARDKRMLKREWKRFESGTVPQNDDPTIEYNQIVESLSYKGKKNGD